MNSGWTSSSSSSSTVSLLLCATLSCFSCARYQIDLIYWTTTTNITTQWSNCHFSRLVLSFTCRFFFTQEVKFEFLVVIYVKDEKVDSSQKRAATIQSFFLTGWPVFSSGVLSVPCGSAALWDSSRHQSRRSWTRWVMAESGGFSFWRRRQSSCCRRSSQSDAARHGGLALAAGGWPVRAEVKGHHRTEITD